MNHNYYVKIRFNDKTREHPYVIRVSKTPSDNYGGWNAGLVEGHEELAYGACPNGCVKGADAILIPKSGPNDYTYRPAKANKRN